MNLTKEITMTDGSLLNETMTMVGRVLSLNGGICSEEVTIVKVMLEDGSSQD